MCNLSAGVFNKGFNSGYDSGHDSGILEGRLEQAKETAYELKDMGMPDEMVAKAVKASVEAIQEWTEERGRSLTAANK